MENLLKGLLVVGGEIKVTSVSETASVEVSGKFIIERGNFKQEFYYWARTYEQFGNFAKIDDYEYESQTTMLGNLPIDNLGKLIQTLNDSGLSTLAKGLGFSDEETISAIHSHVQNHKIFKAVYGKKVVLWDLLTQDERQIAYIEEVLSNYDKVSEHFKRCCALTCVDEEGNVTPNYNPTKEELQKRLEELS
jgi:hypothetical protein